MTDLRPHLNINEWLDKLDLLLYQSLFQEYKGVEDILWMTERDLKNLGIRNGSHRARIGSSLAALKDKVKKSSRGNINSLSPNGNSPSTERARSNTSMSPINKNYPEEHTGVRSWPSTRHSTSHPTKLSSPVLQSSVDNFVGTETTAKDLKKALLKELSLDNSDIRSYAWYHGTILRQRAEDLLMQDGDFLVRDCVSQPGDYVITCKWKSEPLHFIIQKVLLFDKKMLLQSGTPHERVQYCFEKERFDSIPDFITYYVGSRSPLSKASGVIISQPVNRVMPLSYYSSRYGVECQIHYVAKALEKISSSPDSLNNNDNLDTDLVEFAQPSQPQISPREMTLKFGDGNTSKHNQQLGGSLVRMGSDPTLSPNTQRRSLDRRPNSGLFNSEILQPLAGTPEDKPPPKPSRVPSRKFSQKPQVRQVRKISENEDIDNSSANAVPIPARSLAHANFERQISETRFSFLDRSSVSSGCSTPTIEEHPVEFTMPNLDNVSIFEPQNFKTAFLSAENSPLESSVLSRTRQLLLSYSPKVLSQHLTRVDLEVARHNQTVDLGLGVVSGLELLLLPQGDQIQKDLLERCESMKLFVAVLILTTPEEKERVEILNRWIEIAIETKTALGNFYGFTSIMLALTLPEILGLQSTWLNLRHYYTNTAFAFETKLKPTFKALHNAAGPEAPNTCLPYIFPLILIFQQYMSVMNAVDTETIDSDSVREDILKFSLPGNDTANDYGLQVLADHLETGRSIMQQILIFKKNGEMSLENVKIHDFLSDIFRTEFHLRVLWGYKGSVVRSEQRHAIFQKVISSLYNKCQMNC